jgi:alkanesulfonate monooxygenase SsuD/methylene tetrahydromethanopterin reductase-like flavin-dependent oxidoreductase (luciferase family)
MGDEITTETTPIGVFLPIEDDPELVSSIEERGYDSVWAGEGQGRSAFGKLERWATVTNDLRLATGTVNTYSRSPATIAQSVATLDDHADGRALLGLGVAHPGVVESFHGIPFDRPLARFEEYVDLVRRYLNGESGGYEGDFFTPSRTEFWEAFEPPRTEIPIYNGVLGPANVRLTGQIADGWVPNFYTLERFREAKEWLATGAVTAGRDISDITIAMYVLVSVADDTALARRRAADHIVSYLRDIPGYYDDPLQASGFVSEVNRITEAPDRNTALEAVSDDLIDAIGITGTPTNVQRDLATYCNAGVDLPVIRAPTGVARDALEDLLDVFDIEG